jgi:hypothetical protein
MVVATAPGPGAAQGPHGEGGWRGGWGMLARPADGGDRCPTGRVLFWWFEEEEGGALNGVFANQVPPLALKPAGPPSV